MNSKQKMLQEQFNRAKNNILYRK